MTNSLSTLTPEEREDRLAIAFLEQYVADVTAGRTHALAHYLAQFPRAEARIAREWLLMTGRLPIAPSPREAAEAEGFGPYRLLRELGRGAQGVVYLAEDTRLHRQVALKVLARELAAVAGPATLRLRREAEAIAKLEHRGIAAIYETGLDAATPWIAMRYVAGGNLQQALAEQTARHAVPRTREDFVRIALLIERAARALACAHDAGILHRDIKPGNLLLAAPDDPVLVDFGLAADEGTHTPTITMPGAVFGTLAYLAPERFAGAAADARSDLYSLGAVLFELSTLQRPYAAEVTAHELQNIAKAPVPSLRAHNPEAPADLAVIVATAIAKSPIDRYATAAAFADDLARFRNFEPIAARAATPLLRVRRWAQRNRAVAWSLAALAFVFVAGLVTTTWLWRRSSQALEDVRRLADLKLARELQGRADRLWPAAPEQLPALQQWRDEFAKLRERVATHQQRLQVLPVAGIDAAADWEREQLSMLLEVHQHLGALDGQLTARIDTARTLAARTIDDVAAAWRAAADRVAANARYGGLQLTPQLGLVPLGPDPQSTLEEFAHVLSGTVPTRDAASHALRLDDDSAIVLVLVPGGRTLLGAEPAPPADGHAANVDPELPIDQGPGYVVDLEPFLLSRCEMTQAQWQRHTGRNPATYRVGGGLSKITTLQHPVELVTWDDVDTVLRQLDLCLPTEAQWEHAYRAGTSSPYPFGSDPKGVIGRENLADVTARDGGANPQLRFVDWLDDGWLVHAPVGSYRPNGWGFYDMGGNVKEWCEDYWEYYRDAAPRPGDGLRRGKSAEYRILRGGCYSSYIDDVRSAARGGVPRHVGGPEAGVRPARRWRDRGC